MKVSIFLWLFFSIPICSIFPGLRIFLVPGQCLGNQQSILLQLKNSLMFDSAQSTKLVHWNQNADCCLWEGVNCSEGHVVGLDLSSESIYGGLDNSSSIFSLQYLQNLSLAYNYFYYSEIPSEFDKLKNLSLLEPINAGFAGQIPIAISRLTRLVILDLSALQFLGTPLLKLENPDLEMLVQNLPELIELYLDGVNISAQGNEWCLPISSSLPKLRVLSLSNCYLSGPMDSSLLNLQALSIIRLDNNNLSTPVPEFFANFRNLTSLGLSSCGLTAISREDLPGQITLQLARAPESGEPRLALQFTEGSIPLYLFSLPSLRKLQLSNNHFSGQLNELSNISSYLLDTLDLSSNELEGPIPLSFFKLRGLLILSLSSNYFSGPLQLNVIHQMRNLSNLDLSYNNLSIEYSGAMMDGEDEARSELTHLQFNFLGFDELHYQDSVSVTVKGLDIELVKILTIFTSIDLSCNSLDGRIPEDVGVLKSLYVLNLSHNGFTGQIPISLANLTHLESLDLSSNKLTGNIPVQLAESLNFLSVLNLSFNHLVGKIPNAKQFSTFSDTSFEGNKGLCGFPLKDKCTPVEAAPPSPLTGEIHSNSKVRIDWNFISAELGFIFGFGVFIWPLMFWKRWRICDLINVGGGGAQWISLEAARRLLNSREWSGKLC
ncbi:Receptor-like protein 12 [Morella rubra]|uniref:Receptor-like protein 12 n=1 Tax=Morella rubra TaxID=262757 RepID=A0A6A1VXY1_9ROSI|nr:Receptor-like protein 12 [Morella rubra]